MTANSTSTSDGWKASSRTTDFLLVRETLRYVVADPGDPLDEQHDIQEFITAHESNEEVVPEDDTPWEDAPPLAEPWIAFELVSGQAGSRT